MQRRSLFAVLLVLGLLLSGCGADEPSTDTGAGAGDPNETPAAEGGGEVLITAVEYEFDLPDELPAGQTTFTLKNDGEEPHFIDIVKLTDDAPELSKLLKMKEKEIGQHFEGQPNHIPTVKPGKTGAKTLDLELVPGRYAYVCFIETKDGTPHAFLGMAGEFSVQ